MNYPNHNTPPIPPPRSYDNNFTSNRMEHSVKMNNIGLPFPPPIDRRIALPYPNSRRLPPPPLRRMANYHPFAPNSTNTHFFPSDARSLTSIRPPPPPPLRASPQPQHHLFAPDSTSSHFFPSDARSSTSIRIPPPPPPPPPPPLSVTTNKNKNKRSSSRKPKSSTKMLAVDKKHPPAKKKRSYKEKVQVEECSPNFELSSKLNEYELDLEMHQNKEKKTVEGKNDHDTSEDSLQQSQPIIEEKEEGEVDESQSNTPLDQCNHSALETTLTADAIISSTVDQAAKKTDAMGQSSATDLCASADQISTLDEELASHRTRVLRSILQTCASPGNNQLNDPPQKEEEQTLANNDQFKDASISIPDILALNTPLMLYNIWESSEQKHLIRIFSNDPIILPSQTKDGIDNSSDSDAMDESIDEIETDDSSKDEHTSSINQRLDDLKKLLANKIHEVSKEDDNAFEYARKTISADMSHKVNDVDVEGKLSDIVVKEKDLNNQKLSMLKQLYALKVKERTLKQRESQCVKTTSDSVGCDIRQAASDKEESAVSASMVTLSDTSNVVSIQTVSNNSKDAESDCEMFKNKKQLNDENNSNSIHQKLVHLKKLFATKLKERQKKTKQCDDMDAVQLPTSAAKEVMKKTSSQSSVNGDEHISNKEKLLIQKQKLKRDIEISNLRMLVSRQRTLLSTYNKKLMDQQLELSQCDSEIEAEEQKIADCQEKIHSVEKRKVRMEGLLVRATRNLVDTRSKLNKVSNISSSTHSRYLGNQNEPLKEGNTVPANRKRAADFF